MKENKGRERPKNSFTPSSFQPETNSAIISDDIGVVVKDKLKALIQLHHRTTVESGYNEALAYRVIIICLTSQNQDYLNLSKEVNHFFNHCLQNPELDKIQLCFDLLLLKEMKQAIKEQYIRVFKVRLLKALRSHYKNNRQKEERKKCGYTLQEYCKISLQKDCLKKESEMYEEVLDALIQEMKFKISKFVGRKNEIRAIEEMTSFVGILQKSQHIVSSKYQQQLMEAYWTLARLHDNLHYLAYTKKYASIALNIAKRIEHPSAVQQLKTLLDKLA